MNKVALITGIGGMDAKTLTHILLNKGYTVIATHRRNSLLDLEGTKALFKLNLELNPKAKLDFFVCDISDQNSVKECIKDALQKYGKIDEIYMLAAMSHVGNSFKMKELCVSVNGMSYYYFLEAIRELTKTTRVYGALTSELAGNVKEDATFTEQTIWNPKSPYAIGKALGGHWLKFYRESLDAGLFCCFGVLFNHSNTYRSKDFFIRKVTNMAARICHGKEKEIKLGNLDFYRDEHWSDFGCEMMWKMLQQERPKDYVIATGVTHHGEEYLDEAFKYFNLDWKKFVVLDKSLLRPNEVVRLVGDSDAATKDLGWNPRRMTFKEHIELLCEFDSDLEACGKSSSHVNYLAAYPNVS